jgi:23S rRNA A2030 N6-methylase RlmJ
VFPLATMWRGTKNEDFQAFACELEATRFASLTARCRGFSTHRGHIAKGDAFSLSLTTNADHPGVSILYLNPPYDTDKEHGRLEEQRFPAPEITFPGRQ